MTPASPERSLATSYDDAARSPGLLLWRVTNRWQATVRAALKPYGVTHVQFVLLASLTWLGEEGPVTQKRLADHAATDPMMTSQVLRALEGRGLVERRAHPIDGRAKALAVTPEGAELANATVTVVEACDREFFAALRGDASSFATALRTLAGDTGTTRHTRRRCESSPGPPR
ncbi:MAG: MarR family winged helix-turn-helix transcriptional regulator [Mycobacteriales bacterium]